MIRKLFIFACMLSVTSVFGQLSSFGLSYGIGGVNSTQNSLQFPSHQGHFDFNKFIYRNFSAGFNANFKSSPSNYISTDSLRNNKLSTVGLGLTIKYWFLNDIRLRKSMSRKTTKGQDIALAYKFKMYLIVDGGFDFNVTKFEDFNFGALYAGGGLGFNFYQWSLNSYSGFVSQSANHLIIPFAEIIYDYYFTSIGTSKNWQPHNLFLKVGLKLAFTYF